MDDDNSACSREVIGGVPPLTKREKRRTYLREYYRIYREKNREKLRVYYKEYFRKKRENS